MPSDLKQTTRLGQPLSLYFILHYTMNHYNKIPKYKCNCGYTCNYMINYISHVNHCPLSVVTYKKGRLIEEKKE